jgi:two-component system LytT family response regulator
MALAQAYHSGQLLSAVSNSKRDIKSISSPFILIPRDSGYDIIRVVDIVMIKAASNYSRLYLNNGISYLMTKTLKSLEKQIHRHGFCRTHQSYLINMQCIRRVNGGKNMVLEMDNGLKACVSRANRKSFQFHLSFI